MSTEWWRTAVIYQIYPRSFADANGDGVGDLAGITTRLPALRELGVDAVWLSPFSRSPQRDAGYDVSDYCDVDPLFGTLADFDAMLETAHALGLRVIADLVPNHSSSDHPLFQAALAAGPGSPERARYLFRDGRGERGELPPNNWESIFGGPAWSRVTETDGRPGQWYLHLFDASQPDFDWTNTEVRELFKDVLRFWLDRGIDGFRVDVAHGMMKAPGLPDYTPPPLLEGETASSMGGAAHVEAWVSEDPDAPLPPFWGQDSVHPIYREWRTLVDGYPGERILAGEAWIEPLSRMAHWVRPDEMHQAFNFAYLLCDWDASHLRRIIDASRAAFGGVGAPSTWVLSNHDVIRHATRLALTVPSPQGEGVGPRSKGIQPHQVGLRRARAATALMLALPGSAYIYQGEELGLPEVIDLPDSARQDPTWFRTNGERYGRDGCRVPIPWVADAPSYGFGPTDASWLPQPAQWAVLARDIQSDDPTSTLSLYRTLLGLRRELALGAGTLEWVDEFGPEVLAFRNGQVLVIANLGTEPVALPAGTVLVTSAALEARGIPNDTTVWLQLD
ncbi:MAG TPA: alpha-amylase family glycosyl hydrolase [Candidatus Lumbricidophila sp.]|nr:alpha-amylase family glycosyl hydrolase [Candidatus Lumbricidophila sp.]